MFSILQIYILFYNLLLRIFTGIKMALLNLACVAIIPKANNPHPHMKNNKLLTIR